MYIRSNPYVVEVRERNGSWGPFTGGFKTLEDALEWIEQNTIFFGRLKFRAITAQHAADAEGGM